MVINQFEVISVTAFEAVYDSPIGPDSDGIKPFHVSFERVKCHTGQVESVSPVGGVQYGQNTFDFIDHIRAKLAMIAALMETLKPSVLKTLSSPGER
jgi:hypothetical protein